MSKYCLPYPHSTDIAPLRVPYLHGEPYFIGSGATFQDFFPIHLRLAVMRQVFLSVQQKERKIPSPRLATAEIIQSWLFFGLASEALGRDVNHADFFAKDTEHDGQPQIDLRMPKWFLVDFQKHWVYLERTLSPQKYDAIKTKFMGHCTTAIRALGVLDLKDETEDHEHDYAKVLLSVHVLLYLIGTVFPDITLMRASLKLTSTRFLVQRMLEHGWCRKRLNQFEPIHVFVPTLYYLSSTRPPRLREENHKNCLPSTCRVQTQLAQPSHRTPECLCHDIASPIEEVLKLIASGEIPLIRIRRTEGGDVRLEVVAYNRNIPFTAISHVWADRQLGSSNNSLPKCQILYLDEVLALLPRRVDHWEWRDRIPSRFCEPIPEGKIRPPSRSYEYFWLDTFCIPQAPEHAELRSKAIDAMNLIYATAAHTLVVDAGLQKSDVGQTPQSQSEGGRASYYAPSDEYLRDALAQICASNWMGRAWSVFRQGRRVITNALRRTLQEGILSGHLVFVFKGSLAYLTLLRPRGNFSLFQPHQTFLQKCVTIAELMFNVGSDKDVRFHIDGRKHERASIEDYIRSELFGYAKSTLNVEEYKSYSRHNNAQAERFKKAHILLQSRSTTQLEDVPLILINMSGLNGNAVTHNKNASSRMQLLFYALGKAPAELVFGNCARVIGCEEDSWIPTEIIPCNFDCDHSLELGPEGWTFKKVETGLDLEFYVLPSIVDWSKDVYFLVPSGDAKQSDLYRATAVHSANVQTEEKIANDWCVIIRGDGLRTEGALFKIVRKAPERIFLRFTGTLKTHCFPSGTADEQKIEGRKIHTTIKVDSKVRFIIAKSTVPRILAIPRPQNPVQYSDRIMVISGLTYFAWSYLERYIRRFIFGDIAETWRFLSIWVLLTLGKPAWIEDKITAFVHYAWVKTFQPGWTADGRWKWFWKLSNYEPRWPFKTMFKKFCAVIFSVYFMYDLWAPLGVVCLYWWVVFPKEELLGMFITSTIFKLGARYFL